ncbi:MAG TPA: SGNH/GDSL hydrolase family protein [Verrucomicrobiales bacterium]|nr:SGNH/GDSL hydrolase family protein [Verrucomicrobiales bacterium]
MIAKSLSICALLAIAAPQLSMAEDPPARPVPAWVEPMKKVHARFTGTSGTFAQFGDSITVTMAFWTPLESAPKNMSPEAASAHQLVKSWIKPECWRKWKGAEYGSESGMTIRWAAANVDKWLTKLNPEAALIMFGSNDVTQLEVPEYTAKTRAVVERCLANGTVVILSTMPPRSGRVDKSEKFAAAVRTLATELKVPLLDYHAAILERRPDDWDGSLPKFKSSPGDDYQVPTLIARDGVHPSAPSKASGDFSVEALRTGGYTLRNYLTLLSCADVIRHVLKPSK